MIALAIVMNIASPGETIVEKKRLRASRESSLSKIPSTARKKTISRTTHCERRIAINIASSMRITSESTTANPVNLPNIIAPRLIGLESIR